MKHHNKNNAPTCNTFFTNDNTPHRKLSGTFSSAFSQYPW